MTRMEMIEKAKKMSKEELETAEFLTEMVDRWTAEDYTWIRVLRDELRTRA